MNLPLLENQKNLVGKKTLLRLDLNVPIKDDKVVDDFRIRKILPTLELLHSAGAKTIILSHLEGKGGDSLRPIWQELIKKYTISFSANFSQLSKKIGFFRRNFRQRGLCRFPPRPRFYCWFAETFARSCRSIVCRRASGAFGRPQAASSSPFY